MLISRVGKRIQLMIACLTVVGFIGVTGGGVSSASAQGLFEALFGMRSYDSPQGQSLRPSQPPHRVMRMLDAQKTKTKRASKRPAERALLTELTNSEPYVAPPVMGGPVGRFLRDPTLRSGDIVATGAGLMVFRGSQGSRHSERDFVSLSRAGGLVARNGRTELVQLERAIDGSLEEPPVAFSSAPIVAQDDSGKRHR